MGVLSPTDRMIAEQAIAGGLITKKQALDAIADLKAALKNGQALKFQEHLISKGYLTGQQIVNLAGLRFKVIRQADRHLASIIIQKGFSSAEHVTECLDLQKARFEKDKEVVQISTLLLDKQYVTRFQFDTLTRLQAEALKRVKQAEGDGQPAKPAEPPVEPDEGALPPIPNLPDTLTMNSRTVEIQKRGNPPQSRTVAIVQLGGQLDAHTFPCLEKYLDALLSAAYPMIILDVQGLQYISSAGIAVLLGFTQRTRESDGDLRLCCLSENVRAVVDLLGFNKYIRMYDSVRGAVESFGYL